MKKLIAPIAFFLILHSSNAQDYKIRLQDIPLATPSQVNKWNETKEFLLGIQGNDPVENTPASTTQDDTYRLLTPGKRNLAGIFNRYGTQEETHGYDWNLMIEPFDDYMYVYRLALQNTRKDVSQWFGIIDYDKQRVRCSGQDYNGKPAIVAEIAPFHRLLNDNIWFKGTNGNHCKEGEYLKYGDTVAVYGCPVYDNNHGYNPEIHPAQQIWFRNKEKTLSANDQFYWLFFLQDVSQRFGNWVNSPLYGQYKIAFKLNPNTIASGSNAINHPLTMNISVARKYDLVTDKYPIYNLDSDDGYTHSLVVNGMKLLTVNEPQAEDLFLGIKFVEITKLSDGTIQGYVQISMVLGNYNTDDLGVCVLELEIKKESHTTTK